MSTQPKIVSSDSDAEIQAALGDKRSVIHDGEKPSNPATDEVENKASSSGEDEAGEPAADKNSEKKNGVQKRIERLSRQKREFRREAEALRAENMALRQQTMTQKPDKAKPDPKSDDGAPKPEEFQTHAEFVRALTRFEVKQAEETRSKEERESKERKTFEERDREFGKNRKEFEKTHADYSERMDAVEDINMSVAVRDAVLLEGPELLYHMTEDPDEFKRLCSLDEKSLWREIGKVQAKSEAAKAAQSKEDKGGGENRSTGESVPRNPKPVSPVGGGKVNTQVTAEEVSRWSIKEYDRRRNEGWIPPSDR